MSNDLQTTNPDYYNIVYLMPFFLTLGNIADLNPFTWKISYY
jgi:hypothetical protein